MSDQFNLYVYDVNIRSGNKSVDITFEADKEDVIDLISIDDFIKHHGVDEILKSIDVDDVKKHFDL
jgi:hypothetical protein